MAMQKTWEVAPRKNSTDKEFDPSAEFNMGLMY